MRRLIMTIVALPALVAIGAAAAVTAARPPTTYPELRVGASASGLYFQPVVTAGRYLVTLGNGLPDGVSLAFVQAPPGRSLAEVRAALADPDAAPDWLYGATFAGGPYASGGDSGQGIVDLTAGDWLVWGGEHFRGPLPVLHVAAAVAPDVGVEPEVSVSVQMREYSFGGLKEGVSAGPQVWRVTNAGDQPHLMDVVQAPAPVRVEQVMALLSLPEGAASPPGIPAYDDFEQVAGPGTLSPGQTAWLVLPDLAPGTYVAACFVPDREAKTPHAHLGMVQVFTVGKTGSRLPAN